MKTIFWNVDTQYDFMRNDESFRGALPVEGARSIEANLEKLTKYARANSIQVVNTADWHTLQSKEISDKPDFETTFPPHCLQGTKGAEYVPATKPNNPYAIEWNAPTIDEKVIAAHKGDVVILKDAFDVFAGNPHADKIVDILNPDNILVYGVATNVCVNYAVIGLAEKKKRVYVVADAIKELPSFPLDKVLKKWEGKGVKLVSTEEVISGKYIR